MDSCANRVYFGVLNKGRQLVVAFYQGNYLNAVALRLRNEYFEYIVFGATGFIIASNEWITREPLVGIHSEYSFPSQRNQIRIAHVGILMRFFFHKWIHIQIVSRKIHGARLPLL